MPPQHESDSLPSSVQQSGPGVWVPLALAHALFDCYYGGGPRFKNRTDRLTPPPIPTDPSSMGGGRPEAQVLESGKAVLHETLVPGFKPRGFAARTMMGGGAKLSEDATPTSQSDPAIHKAD